MANTLIGHSQLLARYNASANRILDEACGELADQERKLRRRAFFHSIHGTLNHIMVGDRIWLARFAGGEGGGAAVVVLTRAIDNPVTRNSRLWRTGWFTATF